MTLSDNILLNTILLIAPLNWLQILSGFLSGNIIAVGTYLLYRYYIKLKHEGVIGDVHNFLEESGRLRLLIDNLPEGIYIKNKSCNYIIANSKFVKNFGFENPESLFGKSDSEIFAKEDSQISAEEDQKLLSGKVKTIKRIHTITDGNDNKKYFQSTKIPLKNKIGQTIGIVGTFIDVTEQEVAKQDLAEKHNIIEKERNLLRTLMDHMPDTIYIKDAECRFLDGNPAQITVTKAKSFENLLGKTDFDFYPKDIAEIFYKDDRKILDSGDPVINKEEIGFDGEGNIRVRSTTKVPFRDKDGKIAGLVGIGRDITDFKEAEEKLKEQAQSLQEINVLLEERQEEINQQSDELNVQNKKLEEERNLLRTLIDNIPDYIYYKDAHSKFVTVNKKMMEAFKTDNLENVIGKTDKDFYPEDFAAQILKDDKTILQTGKPIIDKEEPGLNSEGNFIQLLTSKVPFINPDGEIVGIIGIARDITAIKEAELKLKEQSRNLKEVNVILEERQEEIQQQSSELSSQNKILENERNILRTLIDTIPDVIYIKDKDSRFITANKRILEVMKAKDQEELEGKTDFDYYPKKIAQLFFDDEQKIITSGKALINKEEIGFDVNGNERVISTTKVPFYDADGNIAGIVGVGRDVTELIEIQNKLTKQAENLQSNNILLEERQEEIQKQSESLSEQNETLEKERNLLRTLIDHMPDYIYIKDKESHFLTVNKRLLKVMQVKSLEDLVGKTDFDISLYHEAAQQFYDDEREIIKTGKPIINKEEIGFDENGRERVISTTKVPFYDISGKISGIVGIGRDITKQKNAERQLREQAQNLQEVNIILEERQEKIQQQSEELNNQAQSLKKANVQLEQLNATKNKFFSIIAHDLKNPFQAIFGFSELLLRNFEDFDDPQKLELLNMIKSSSESAYNLLDNLLQWARTQTDRIKYNPVNIDVSELIQQNIELSQASAENKQISLVSEVECSSNAFADKNMINLVIRNLMSNAIKFTDEGGVITVTCHEHGKKELSISISDTGIGISEDNIQKLFRIDEYFSTSGTAGESGTGLGLIICKEFVEKNKGNISIDSKIGEGTTFTFTLPVAKA
ncbi:MAG: PAS domain-containing sensor histidine kinase [Bacteroidales bacterium]|nr:PAS domain-containing sensor histidine kinase [Bacteroidales bacterium]